MTNTLHIQKEVQLPEDRPAGANSSFWLQVTGFPDSWVALLEEPLARRTLIPAPSRDAPGKKAHIMRLSLPETLLEQIFPGIDPASAKLLFAEVLSEQGWEMVPARREIAYLYAEIVDGELHSWLKFDLGIRHYVGRNQLLPNITRRLRRFVVLYPDLLTYLEESFSDFARQCYIFSRVVQRVAGVMDPLPQLARQNGVSVKKPEDVLMLLEKLAGQQVNLSSGRALLDPVDWPIHPADIYAQKPEQ